MTKREWTLVDLTTDDLPRIRELEEAVWFEVTPGATLEHLAEGYDFRHARAVERPGGRLPGETGGAGMPLAGLYSAFDMQVTVPGPAGTLTRLPMDGLTMVSVHPDARRRGVLSAMMRDHLHRIHDRGECAVAGLHASEPAIYGRFGYGNASHELKLVLSRGTELRVPAAISDAADDVRTHVVTAGTPEGMAALHEAHLAAAAVSLGAVTRPDAMAGTWFRDQPTARGKLEPLRVMLARRGDELTGYARFRREGKWEDGSPRGEVMVAELGAVDDASLLALARRLLDLDLTSTVTFWGRSMDDPLIGWSGGHRQAGIRIFDALWLRLVDVPRALSERGYDGALDLVLEVVDELCPWNAGRWRLRVDEDGMPRVDRSDADADLVLPVAALGAAYAGGRPLAAQVATLGVTEVTGGAVRRLSRSMRGDLEPVPAIGF